MQEESLEKSACDHYCHLVIHCHFVGEILYNCKEQFWSLFGRQQCFLGRKQGAGLKQKLLLSGHLKSEFMETNLTSGSIQYNHIRAPPFFIFANCHLQFLQFVFHFSHLILSRKSESTVAHRVFILHGTCLSSHAFFCVFEAFLILNGYC